MTPVDPLHINQQFDLGKSRIILSQNNFFQVHLKIRKFRSKMLQILYHFVLRG